MSPCLEPHELLDITHKRQAAAQLRELRRLGIKAHRRTDGTVCVLRAWLAQPAVHGAESAPRVKRVERRR